MSTAADSNRPALDPKALRLEDLAKILGTCGPRAVTVASLRDDLDDGAPANADGTVNLVHYVAWLVRELARGD